MAEQMKNHNLLIPTTLCKRLFTSTLRIETSTTKIIKIKMASASNFSKFESGISNKRTELFEKAKKVLISTSK